MGDIKVTISSLKEVFQFKDELVDHVSQVGKEVSQIEKELFDKVLIAKNDTHIQYKSTPFPNCYLLFAYHGVGLVICSPLPPPTSSSVLPS